MKKCTVLLRMFLFFAFISSVQISKSQNKTLIPADRSEFTIIITQDQPDTTFGAGYSFYAAAWPLLCKYPGQWEIQSGLVSTWMDAQPTGNEPPGSFYSDIEGGLGWWHDTRFGKKTPKFIMGGVALNFSAWANGVGAGSCSILPDGHRDWSEPGGLYGVAQLSPYLLWPPDGLNMKQGTNGELLGYGYLPLPLTEPMEQTNGVDVTTGNNSWTLFLNTTNFKGPATFFLPTFWSKPSVEDPSLEGLFLDSRPSNPNVYYGIETATIPAVAAYDDNENAYAHVSPTTYPVSGTEKSVLVRQPNVYSKEALWNSMEEWFDGGSVVEPGLQEEGVDEVYFSYQNNGAWLFGEIKINEAIPFEHPIDFEKYVQPFVADNNSMGFEWDLNYVNNKVYNFETSEYFRLMITEGDTTWWPVAKEYVPESTGLLYHTFEVQPGDAVSYLTPMEPDCPWQNPDGPWQNPGPAAGPFQVELGDGSVLKYYWYKFINQPAIVQANLPESQLTLLQDRAELIHTYWNHQMEYLAPSESGTLASLDPGLIVTPPEGLEVGYVPIVTRQEKAPPKIKVFILAGQSNMEGHGKVYPSSTNGTLIHFLDGQPFGEFSFLRDENGNFIPREDVWVRYDREYSGLKTGNLDIGFGYEDDFIGPEYGFGHQLGEFLDDQVLIIKTAWGGKSLAVDFRPPSSGGTTGPYYEQILIDVNSALNNIQNEFPQYSGEEIEIVGFGWFQGWNDGAEREYLEEYESNMINFITDIRDDLDAPDMKFVIGLTGHGGFEKSNDLWVQDMQYMIVPAQFNAAFHPDFDGTGLAETRPFWREPDESPSNAIHHWNDNGESFLKIGDQMGRIMIRMLEERYTPVVDKYTVPFCEVDSVQINGIWESDDGVYGEILQGIDGSDSLVNIITVINVEILTDVNVNEYTLNAVMGPPNYEGVTYQWLDCDNSYLPLLGAVNQSYTPPESGSYAVEITYYGCSDTSECYTVNFPDYVIDASVNPENSGNITGTGIYTYGQIAELLASREPGFTFLNWTEYGNIVSTDSIYSFTVNQNRTLVANFELVSNIETADSEMFSIFPNPSSGIFTIELDKTLTNTVIQIFKISGEKVYEEQATESKLTIDYTSLNNGVYFIRCVSGAEVFETKFILNK